MVKIAGSIESSDKVKCMADPWIPLSLSWLPESRDQPLYAMVDDCENGGYLELKVDPWSGALKELVVITLPTHSDRTIDDCQAQTEPGEQVPIFDVSQWKWKVTPDYKEPFPNNVIKSTAPLRYSRHSGRLILWFSHSPVHRYLTCDRVQIGVSAGNDLVNVVTSPPMVINRDGTTTEWTASVWN